MGHKIVKGRGTRSLRGNEGTVRGMLGKVGYGKRGDGGTRKKKTAFIGQGKRKERCCRGARYGGENLRLTTEGVKRKRKIVWGGSDFLLKGEDSKRERRGKREWTSTTGRKKKVKSRWKKSVSILRKRGWGW